MGSGCLGIGGGRGVSRSGELNSSATVLRSVVAVQPIGTNYDYLATIPLKGLSMNLR